MAAVVDAEPCGDGVTGGSADGEGGHEGLLRHLECSRSKDEGRERHGRGQDGGKGDGQDGVALHPIADAVEDARGDALLEEGDAAGLADLIAEVSAGCGAKGGDQNEEEPVVVAGGKDDDHDVGDAGDREGHEGGVDDGDEEESEEAEAEEEVQQR